MAIRLQACLQDFADRGITTDKLTADEITALVHACERVDNPYADVNAELCGRPVEVCRGLYLWPVTAGAQIWLTEYAGSWWPKGSMMYRWAQVYALHNARDQHAFADLTTKGAARAAILRCMLRFCCHRDELAVAVNRCYGLGMYDTLDTRKNLRNEEMAEDLASFVAALEVHSGIKADHWMWGRSLNLVVKDYYRMRDMARALGGGADMDYEFNEALENLGRVKDGICRRFEEQEHGGK